MPSRLLLPLLAILPLIGALSASGQAPPPVPTWRLEEEWRVGGEPDGPRAFDSNFGLGLLPGGGLVHFDYKTAQLHFLDAQGQPVRSVSRLGAGPGETRFANGFAVSPKGVVVVNDRGNGRFTRFTPAGEFLDVITDLGSRSSLGNGWDAHFLNDGRLVERIGLLAVPDRDVTTQLWSADLKHATPLHPEACNPAAATEFATTRVPLRNAEGGLVLYVPIVGTVPDVPVAYDPAGFVWEARSLDSNEIVKRPIGSCTVVATIRLGGVHIPITPSMVASLRARIVDYAKRIKGRDPEFPEMPKFGSWFDTLHVDGAGNLWVERHPVSHAPIEVYSPTGKLLATMDPAWKVNSAGPMIITRDHLYGMKYDRDGVAYLAAMRIVK